MRRGGDDVWSLACQLAPHSARLASFLAMLDRNRNRIDRTNDPIRQLPRLVEDVMACLGVNEDGEFLALSVGDKSEPQTIDAALRWMERRHYVHTSTHWNQIWKAERIGAYAPLLRWLDDVVKSFAIGFGIPVCAESIVVTKADHARLFVMDKTALAFGECPSHHGFGVELVHAIRGADLPAKCWDVFTEIGFEFAGDHGLQLEHWSSRPEHWWVKDWAVLKDQSLLSGDEIEPDAKDWARSPPGERERLLKYYGVIP